MYVCIYECMYVHIMYVTIIVCMYVGMDVYMYICVFDQYACMYACPI